MLRFISHAPACAQPHSGLHTRSVPRVTARRERSCPPVDGSAPDLYKGYSGLRYGASARAHLPRAPVDPRSWSRAGDDARGRIPRESRHPRSRKPHRCDGARSGARSARPARPGARGSVNPVDTKIRRGSPVASGAARILGFDVADVPGSTPWPSRRGDPSHPLPPGWPRREGTATRVATTARSAAPLDDVGQRPPTTHL